MPKLFDSPVPQRTPNSFHFQPVDDSGQSSARFFGHRINFFPDLKETPEDKDRSWVTTKLAARGWSDDTPESPTAGARAKSQTKPTPSTKGTKPAVESEISPPKGASTRKKGSSKAASSVSVSPMRYQLKSGRPVSMMVEQPWFPPLEPLATDIS